MPRTYDLIPCRAIPCCAAPPDDDAAVSAKTRRSPLDSFDFQKAANRARHCWVICCSGRFVNNKVDAAWRVIRVSAIALGVTALPQPGLAHCQIGQVAEIPVETAPLPLAHAEINGQPVSVLIDTGAFQSLIWRTAAQRLGLHLTTGPKAVRLYGVGGESQLDATVIKELRLEKFTARDLRIPVAGDRKTNFEMLLGEDFWSVTALELDLKHQVVRMMEPKGCKTDELPYWAKTYSMADLLASPRDARGIQVNVLLNGHAARAKIDSGAFLSVVSKGFADRAGVSYQGTSAEIVGIGGKSLESRVGRFQTFTIGDETINNVQVLIAQLDKNMTTQELGSRIAVAAVIESDMLLGADFLRAHRVLIDNSTRKMVFTYEGGPVFQTSKPSAAAPSTAAQRAQPPSHLVDAPAPNSGNP